MVMLKAVSYYMSRLVSNGFKYHENSQKFALPTEPCSYNEEKWVKHEKWKSGSMKHFCQRVERKVVWHTVCFMNGDSVQNSISSII